MKERVSNLEYQLNEKQRIVQMLLAKLETTQVKSIETIAENIRAKTTPTKVSSLVRDNADSPYKNQQINIKRKSDIPDHEFKAPKRYANSKSIVHNGQKVLTQTQNRYHTYGLAGNLKPLNIGVRIRVRIDDPGLIFLDDVIILPCTNMLQPYKVVSDCQIDTLHILSDPSSEGDTNNDSDINSIGGKFEQLKAMVSGNIDILVVTETKLDDSFPSTQFLIEGYSPPYRRDRNK